MGTDTTATNKILSAQQLALEAAAARAKGLRIAATNGCFDLLHVGHVRFLQTARALADMLIVGINSDASVHTLKGSGRPIVSQDERAEIIAALQCVDYVNIFSQVTAQEFLRAVNPHVYVKGGDYEAQQLPEYQLVKSMGAEIKIITFTPGRSTSELIAKIKTGRG